MGTTDDKPGLVLVRRCQYLDGTDAKHLIRCAGCIYYFFAGRELPSYFAPLGKAVQGAAVLNPVVWSVAKQGFLAATSLKVAGPSPVDVRLVLVKRGKERAGKR